MMTASKGSENPGQIDEDIPWITSVQKGNPAAFTNIVEKYHRPVYNLCYHMLHDTVEAEDATQEVFIRAYLKLYTFDPQRKFSSWLYAIASHYCLDQLKRPRRYLVPLDGFLPNYYLGSDAAAQPEAVLVNNETVAEVRHLLDVLPPHYRAAIILKYWHAMSYQEIAHILDTTVSVIRNILFKARQKMVKAVRRQDMPLPRFQPFTYPVS